MGSITEDAIRQKLIDLDLLKEEERSKKTTSCSSSPTLKLPKELPSIEETLKTLSAALKALETPGLEKNDIFRLRSIIAGARSTRNSYRITSIIEGLEAELRDLRDKYAELSKENPRRSVQIDSLRSVPSFVNKLWQ